jgi:hypothetical protein
VLFRSATESYLPSKTLDILLTYVTPQVKKKKKYKQKIKKPKKPKIQTSAIIGSQSYGLRKQPCSHA